MLTLTRRSSASPQVLWDVVTDMRLHDRWIPLTTVRTDPGVPEVGWTFSAVTGVGPLAFSDDMVVTECSPPGVGLGRGHLRLLKTGRLVAGWAEISVEPEGIGSQVTWTEDIGPRPDLLRRALSPVSDAAGTVLFGRVLDGLVALAESR